MGVRHLLLFFLAGCTSLLPRPALTDELLNSNTPGFASPPPRVGWTARILKGDPQDGEIQGLTLLEPEVPVLMMPVERNRMRPVVSVRFRYQNPGWTLYVRNLTQLVPLSADPDQGIYTYLRSSFSDFSLVAQGPSGEQQTENWVIHAPHAREMRRGFSGELTPQFGISSFTYFQTNYGEFSSTIAQVAVRYNSPKWRSRLGWSAEAHFSFLTLSSRPTLLSPQLLGGRLDGTFLLDRTRRKRLQSTFIFGVDYLTMFTNGAPFGFANLIAPEVGLRFQYALTPRDGLTGEFRFIPIDSLFERGVDLNLTWNRRLFNSRSVSVSLGFADYFYYPMTGISIRVDLLSLRVGYSL